MTKKEKFITIVEELFSNMEIDSDALEFFNELKEKKDKPLFTEKGIAILKFLQTTSIEDKFRAKEIGEETFLSGHSVSGAIRKLVAEDYVSKVGKDPVYYSITEKGKSVDLMQNEVDK